MSRGQVGAAGLPTPAAYTSAITTVHQLAWTASPHLRCNGLGLLPCRYQLGLHALALPSLGLSHLHAKDAAAEARAEGRGACHSSRQLHKLCAHSAPAQALPGAAWGRRCSTAGGWAPPPCCGGAAHSVAWPLAAAVADPHQFYTFLMGRASTARRRSFSASTSSFVTCGMGLRGAGAGGGGHR
jgi:hypothetical protein